MDEYIKEARNAAVTNWYDITSSGWHCQPKLDVCMYGKDRKRYQSMNLACGSDALFTLVYEQCYNKEL